MSLPNEIIGHIIEYLTYDGFKPFILVNRNFYELSRCITQYYADKYDNSLYSATDSLDAFKTVYYNCEKNHKEVLFYYACKHNRSDIVKFLIGKVGKKSIVEQVTANYIYCDIKLVKIFVEHGIDVQKIMNNAETSLTFTEHLCFHGSLEVVKYFAKNSNILDDSKHINEIIEELISSLVSEQNEVCLFLLENGGVLETPSTYNIWNGMRTDNLFFVETHLKYKLIDNINLWLDFACLYKSLEIVELFIKYGAVSRYGIYDSIEKEHFNAVKLLRQREIDPTEVRVEGIFNAIRNGENSILNYYIYFYEFKNWPNEFYKCVDLAWQYNNVDAVYRLFKYRDGISTVLVNAIKNGYVDLIKIFDKYYGPIIDETVYLKIAFKYKKFDILTIFKNRLHSYYIGDGAFDE